ncbi:hypothetical protein AAVH_02849 [Aphelenchoides avenae]|nr:hypothetical protein AAVH_02849 [Aphelenchus avenae]
MVADAMQQNGVSKRGEWKPFTDGKAPPQLYMYNSFTRQKDLFRPIEGNQAGY